MNEITENEGQWEQGWIKGVKQAATNVTDNGEWNERNEDCVRWFSYLALACPENLGVKRNNAGVVSKPA